MMRTLALTAALALLALSTPAHARRCSEARFKAASPAIEQAIRDQFPGTTGVELRCETRWNASLLVSFSAEPRLPGCSKSFALVSVRGTHKVEIAAVFCGGSIRPELYAPAE